MSLESEFWKSSCVDVFFFDFFISSCFVFYFKF